MVLIVTEPTQSGLEDLKRVMELCRHFNLPTLACINKYDINEKMADKIERYCNENNVFLVGKIPYDDLVMKSINELKPIIQYENSRASQSIIEMWNKIYEQITSIQPIIIRIKK